jgi:hypothetical protein
MGIRTPDLLHAIQRQPVHPRVSVQVTVLPRPLGSTRVRACCGTFLLYDLTPPPPLAEHPDAHYQQPRIAAPNRAQANALRASADMLPILLIGR